MVLGIAKLKAEAEMRQVNDNMKPRRLKNELVLLRTLPNGVLRTLPNGGAGILPAFPRGFDVRSATRGVSRSSRMLSAGCGGRFGARRGTARGQAVKSCGPDILALLLFLRRYQVEIDALHRGPRWFDESRTRVARWGYVRWAGDVRLCRPFAAAHPPVPNPGLNAFR